MEFLCSNIFLTGYISGNNTFPKPLDEKEEEKYLQLLKTGDKKAKSILIERNLRLVAHIVKKYQIPNYKKYIIQANFIREFKKLIPK